MKINKLDKKINELNVQIAFVEVNVLEKNLRERFISVLRHQKALIRDIDRKGRKIPENIPSVCEITGLEVNTIREKEPPFKLNQEITGIRTEKNMRDEVFNSSIPHNSYSHLLNNRSLKAMKKTIGRKIRFDDLSGVEENISLIMEVFKHQDYFNKFIDVKSFLSNLKNISSIVDKM